VQAKIDEFVKNPKMLSPVIPAKAGIQEKQGLLDPGFRRGDGVDGFLRSHQDSSADVRSRSLRTEKGRGYT
jgi:hypothetical protein